MAIVEFLIHVDDPTAVEALFDSIEVWRSTTELGTYLDITANDSSAADLVGTVAGPWILNGKTLTILLNGADPKLVTFAGIDPIPLIDVLAQINAVIPGLALQVLTNTGKIHLLSTIFGNQSAVQVSGTAAIPLGLSTSKVNGKSARLLISENTEDYSYRDYDGDITFWYKTRFFSTITGAVSNFSSVRQAGPGAGIPQSATVVGKIALASLDGSPIIGRRIIFVPTGPQVVSDGSGNNYGVLPSVDRITAVTDLNGRAAITLVKNQRLKVFLEGTTFQREFVVPTTDFDILTVASAQPDPLSIVNTPPFPIRVS